MPPPDDDFLDGCDLARFGEPTRDEDVPWLVLLASRLDRDFLVRLHALADLLRT